MAQRSHRGLLPLAAGGGRSALHNFVPASRVCLPCGLSQCSRMSREGCRSRDSIKGFGAAAGLSGERRLAPEMAKSQRSDGFAKDALEY
jgi:hypothetical protein